MSHQSGFTFIELVIAILIASILSMTLYQSFEQIQRGVKTIGVTMDQNALMPVVYNQMERDISGIFVPQSVYDSYKKKFATEGKKNKIDETQESKRLMNNVFLGENRSDSLHKISFITTNRLPLYSSTEPYCNRVIYTLKPEVDGLFTLVRQETSRLDISTKELKGVREFEMLKGVQSLKISYMIPEKFEFNDAKKNQGKAQALVEGIGEEQRKYKELSSWSAESVKALYKNQNSYGVYYMIPAFIKVEGRCVDSVTSRIYRFEWFFKVFGFSGFEELLRRLCRENKSKSVQQKEQRKSNVVVTNGGTHVCTQ